MLQLLNSRIHFISHLLTQSVGKVGAVYVVVHPVRGVAVGLLHMGVVVAGVPVGGHAVLRLLPLVHLSSGIITITALSICHHLDNLPHLH